MYIEEMVMKESDYFNYADDYSSLYDYKGSTYDDVYFDDEGNYIEPELVCLKVVIYTRVFIKSFKNIICNFYSPSVVFTMCICAIKTYMKIFF